MNNSKIKILISYHKPSVLLKDDIFTPIHVGRALATEASKDGNISEEDYQWMLDNMIGDDTGDNISYLNREFCELTAMYWAWKNYDKLGNPEYIGFMHYRRHFIFNNYIDKNDLGWGCKVFDKITPEYLLYSKMYKSSILNTINGYDIITTNQVYYKNNVVDHYQEIMPFLDVKYLLMAKNITQELYPKYNNSSETYYNSKYHYWYHSFIMKKDIFFKYAEWLFSILFTLHKQIDYSLFKIDNEYRTVAYIAERMHGIFITELKNNSSYKIDERVLSFIIDTSSTINIKEYDLRMRFYIIRYSIFLQNNIFNKNKLYRNIKLLNLNKKIIAINNINTKKTQKKVQTGSLKKLKKLIKNYDVISFDIFDTILLRPYAKPKNVFQHLESIYNIEEFSKYREKAEEEYSRLHNIKHVNYDEIYKVLPEKFQFLKEKEIEIEKDTIYVNKEMLEIFNYTKLLGKKIIFVTDMYFSSNIIKEFLELNGIVGDYDIYVSAELRKAKYDKTLFQHLISKLNVNPKNILHIGNNLHSDYYMSIESNIDAYYYLEPLQELFIKYPKIKQFYENNIDSLTTGIIVGLLVKKFLENDKKNIDYWKYFGYFIGGPICYGLTKFIYDEIKNNNIKDVIFVARDGYTIEKIFKLFDNTIKTDYIYAPRILNLLINIDYQNKLPWENKINSLIYTLKIMDKELNLNLDINYNIDKDRFIEQNYRTIKELSNEIRDLYLKYISKFNIKDKNIGLFDISGGNFSSLKIIRNIFPNSNIYGLYWQIADEADRTGILCKSYVENFNNPIKNYELLEFLITAPELPIKYLDKEGNFIRINNKYENIRKNIYDIIYREEINFSKDLLNTFKNYYVSFSYNTLVNLINLFSNFICKEDIVNFKNIKHGMNESHTIYRNLLIYEKNNKLFSISKTEKFIIIKFLGIKLSIKTRQDKTRQDKTRQDKTRQDKTRQDKT